MAYLFPYSPARVQVATHPDEVNQLQDPDPDLDLDQKNNLSAPGKNSGISDNAYGYN